MGTVEITLRCPACNKLFPAEGFGAGLSCTHCGKATPKTVQLAQLLDHWWEPRRWRADLTRPSVNFLLEKLWTADGHGEMLYQGIAPKYTNYSIFRNLVTRAIARGIDEGWMDLDFPEDPLDENPVYRLDFKNSERFAKEMEALFPEVNWDETIELPTAALSNKPPARPRSL